MPSTQNYVAKYHASMHIYTTNRTISLKPNKNHHKMMINQIDSPNQTSAPCGRRAVCSKIYICYTPHTSILCTLFTHYTCPILICAAALGDTSDTHHKEMTTITIVVYHPNDVRRETSHSYGKYDASSSCV